MLKKVILVFTLAVIFGLTSITSLVSAAEKQKAAPKAQTSTGKEIPPNSITQAALKAGCRSCAPRINQVTNFLAGGAKNAGVIIFTPTNNPDKQVFSVSMGIPMKESSAYASASFAPNQASGCAGMYETVFYWPQNCKDVGEKQFTSFKKAGTLVNNIGVLDGGKQTRVFLMPAGAGCVAIKKEIIQ